MSIRTLYLDAGMYLRRHGLKSSIKRVLREVQNRILNNRQVIYCLDLLRGEFKGYAMPENCRVERYDTRSETPERSLKRITEYYSEEVLQDVNRKRNEKRAHLWYLRNDTEDIGYTGSLAGQAPKPYFFPPPLSECT